MIRYILALAALLLLAAAGCATTGATLGSGVGDRLVEAPPYYAQSRAPVGQAKVMHLPIRYQAGSSQEEMFDPSDGYGSPVASLLAEMNAYLDSLGVSARVAAAPSLPGTPPDVRFGCEQRSPGECDANSRDIAVEGKPWMKLAVGRPSPDWVPALRGALQTAGADAALVVTLEVGQYWTRQRNLLGAKEVRLGTGHEVSVPWLTSLEQPVQVLQLTGALVDRDGRALRIGAEGMLAQRTNILLSGIGAQELIQDEDVERLRGARRDDLPGRPLVWQAALQNLVAQLTGQGPLATR